ncbi:peptide-methionine (S)-S-oxide reductase MsrA [Xenorhabdus bovienii]|uniref:Peptide methionine sulfoxide reductase MsrA n=1 Tax=Xenorhabdus bovienii TaxID=40576 RepID=A0AAJ1MXE1_XENBV|nr:peptide-methionine (S)-S-oxide reductase MsrA [Xenorhabdus bovienii]MDE1476948.1 peptide-methionine (S)-S-oxide reductase MsrA [Xenorhabdus bovienii]MDE1485234.1 peptide-methionine (S)-S-oxide reductase MsrA [Xenorhabdus bovienii]MDE1489987.1 peptide-methionine (S)-S-oxide reductase MsrA [Xenorhabdus bovienii]MDE1494693.1 peptide-methionine (S)-S-oxide reductase MsrA [Xenorhabdus bovienii]MDE9456872.1 peptide-methionine (S)-S-oxide reductase MsrA [Xenorhabdus bovienii]
MPNSANESQHVSTQDALLGRAIPLTVSPYHVVTQHAINDIPENMEIAYIGMGCFWGVERLFWQQEGIYTTSVGYSGGTTPNPTYEEVCTGLTGHAEVVRIVFDPTKITHGQLLTLFWENHDPAQGMRQHGDVGTQYRSAIYTISSQQYEQALTTREQFQQAMNENGDQRTITTEIRAAEPFYFAEDYHQQYLFKNPEGYCGLGGIGVCLLPTHKN